MIYRMLPRKLRRSANSLFGLNGRLGSSTRARSLDKREAKSGRRRPPYQDKTARSWWW